MPLTLSAALPAPGEGRGAELSLAASSRTVRARAARITLPHVLLLALALRLVALALPSTAHPDEIFQYLEPAHRLLFGTGVTTWEWRAGMRGWLLPLVIAGPMRLGAALAPDSGLYLLLPRLLMTLASLGIVVSAWRLGARLSRLHALFAGFAAACWYELVFFAPHLMSETAATFLIVPAAMLLLDDGRATPARLLAAGVALGLAASVRFQYAPAIAALALASLWRRPRALALVATGGLAGLIPGAVADAAMGAVPYRWIVENIRLNLLAGRAAGYGTSGPLGLLPEIWPRWSLWGVPLLAAAIVGSRRYPVLAWAAGVNFVFHSAIAHKEYRFVLLSAALVVILAAIGSGDVVRHVARRDGAARARDRLHLIALCWLAASASIAFGAFRPIWQGYGDEVRAFTALRRDPALCGLALYRTDYSRAPGYATLHRSVPLLLIADEGRGDPRAGIAAAQAGVNSILADATRGGELPSAYTPLSCYGAICLYRRPGACAPHIGSGFAIDRVLARNDD